MSLPTAIPEAPAKDDRFHVVYDTSKDKETGVPATGVPATAGNVVVGRPAEALPGNDVEVVAGHVQEPGKGAGSYDPLTAQKRGCCKPWMLLLLSVLGVVVAGGAVAGVVLGMSGGSDDGSPDSESSVSEVETGRGDVGSGVAAATTTTTRTTTTRTTTTRTQRVVVTTTTVPPVTTTTTVSKSLALTLALLAADVDTFIADATVLSTLKTSLLSDFSWTTDASDIEVTFSTTLPSSRRLNLRGLSASRRLSGLAYAAVVVDLSDLSDWETTAAEAAVALSEESYAATLETKWNSALSAASSSQTVSVLSVVADSESSDSTDLCLQMFGMNQTTCSLDDACVWGLLTNSSSICVQKENTEDSCNTYRNRMDANRCLRQSGCTWVSYSPRGRCITLDLYTTTTTRGPTTTRTQRTMEDRRGEFDLCPIMWEDEASCEGAPLCYWNGTSCGRNTSLTRGMEPCNETFNNSDSCAASTSSLCYWNETTTDCNVNATQAKSVAAEFLESHELCNTFFEDEQSCGRMGRSVCIWNSTDSSCIKNATGNATLYEERGLDAVVRALTGLRLLNSRQRVGDDSNQQQQGNQQWGGNRR
mmetsp:Transcript_13149/g.29259  ORF Transcript_13149/g.29259 Transcript_13149/m.29259 type:complete len:590 (-) Transcript_13149:398-2167(-)